MKWPTAPTTIGLCPKAYPNDFTGSCIPASYGEQYLSIILTCSIHTGKWLICSSLDPLETYDFRSPWRSQKGQVEWEWKHTFFKWFVSYEFITKPCGVIIIHYQRWDTSHLHLLPLSFGCPSNFSPNLSSSEYYIKNRGEIENYVVKIHHFCEIKTTRKKKNQSQQPKLDNCTNNTWYQNFFLLMRQSKYPKFLWHQSLLFLFWTDCRPWDSLLVCTREKECGVQ